MSQNAYYVTTPIYYVNDVPHIGHAYTSVAADVLARLYRLTGKPVKFSTGVDEHGQKIEQAAQKVGMTPQAYCDKISQHFRDLSAALNFSEDVFIRTTEDRHKKAAEALWMRLIEREQIYLGSYSGWYSIRDESFFAENELIDGKAPTGAPVEWVEEPSYFFKLSAWQEPLLKYYKEHPDFIGPESRRNEVMRFVEGGLRDLSISRSTFTWGVPVPNDPDHVMYVWVEALSNYLTVLDFPNMNSKEYQTFWPVATHIVGKDIIRHHAVYWPALLMAADLPLPKRVYAHGWLTKEGEKISKSLGNVIDPFELVKVYGVDQVRYFLMREVPFGKDGTFSENAFKLRINSDLANDFGNLVQRVLSFVQKHAEARIPEIGDLIEDDRVLLKMAKAIPDQILVYADQQAIHKICETIWLVVAAANKYVDTQGPWTLRKSDVVRMRTVLYVLMETIRYLAVTAQPIMPSSCKRILDYLAVPEDQRDFKSLHKSHLKPGAFLPKPEPVFPRIEQDNIVV